MRTIMKTKLMITALALLLLLSGAAFAYDAKSRQLLKESDQAATKLHECSVALANAIRHNNVWQEENLSIDECKARAYESIDIGSRLMQDSLKPEEDE